MKRKAKMKRFTLLKRALSSKNIESEYFHSFHEISLLFKEDREIEIGEINIEYIHCEEHGEYIYCEEHGVHQINKTLYSHKIRGTDFSPYYRKKELLSSFK